MDPYAEAMMFMALIALALLALIAIGRAYEDRDKD